MGCLPLDLSVNAPELYHETVPALACCFQMEPTTALERHQDVIRHLRMALPYHWECPPTLTNKQWWACLKLKPPIPNGRLAISHTDCVIGCAPKFQGTASWRKANWENSDSIDRQHCGSGGSLCVRDALTPWLPKRTGEAWLMSRTWS